LSKTAFLPILIAGAGIGVLVYAAVRRSPATPSRRIAPAEPVNTEESARTARKPKLDELELDLADELRRQRAESDYADYIQELEDDEIDREWLSRRA
jgi:hypothetical protein